MKISKLLVVFLLLMISCKNESTQEKVEENSKNESFQIDYAKGFEVEIFDNYTILKITKPWPDADKTFTYLLQKSDLEVEPDIDYDVKINTPLKKLVVTSTTHIPSLEALGVLDKLVGFPNTDYISTESARTLIDKGKIKDVGQNESLNTEMLIALQPDAIVSFAVKGQNKSLERVKQAGIPVLYNADWVEAHPLGKAEWIKFFGLLFDKSKESQQIFNSIKTEYEKAKTLASKVENKPRVLSGALWKDQWYLPGGDSWQAHLITDANANYIYKDTENNGSLSLSFESVLNDAKDAEFWIAPAQYTSYSQMLDQHAHYQEFKAFENKNIFTFAKEKGETGGVIYYEMAPHRPDWVLKDLINIFHPHILPDYQNHFFKALDL